MLAYSTAKFGAVTTSVFQRSKNVLAGLFLNPLSIAAVAAGTLGAVGYIATAIDSGYMSPPRVIGWALGAIEGTAADISEVDVASAAFALGEANQEPLRRTKMADTSTEMHRLTYEGIMADLSMSNIGLSLGAAINDGLCAAGDYRYCGRSEPMRYQMVENRLNAAERAFGYNLGERVHDQVGPRRDTWEVAK